MVMHRWKKSYGNAGAAETLAAATGLSPLVCRVLAARGCDSPEQALALTGGGEELFDPFLLRDMDRAAARIRQAIEAGERIVVYGDYDCDGVTSTALLTSYLETVGADVFAYIPDREAEGYGLNVQAIEFLHKVREIDLIVTVDNGISAHEEIAHANRLGIDVVVIDHHQPRETLPPAAAVVDPHRADCPSPFKNLAGVGVAFKLVCALEGDAGYEMLEHYADLVALGTVGDVVELLGDNRAMVRRGLTLLQEAERPGLRALQRIAGLEGRPMTAESVAFGLVPRINAAGRMGDVYDALNLLLTEDESAAQELAGLLDGYNRSRKEIETEILQDILRQLTADPAPLHRRALVLCGEGWHHGVVGILCSRLVERFGKPAFLISLDEKEGRASGRGVEGLSVIEGVAACGKYLTRFGGHSQAAGFSLKREDVPAFLEAFEDFFRTHYEAMPTAMLPLDCAVALSELTVDAVRSLERLEPTGSGNPSPAFWLENVQLAGVTPLSGGKHVKLRLTDGRAEGQALWFGMPADKLPFQAGERLDLAVTLSINEYNGRQSVSIKVKDARPAGFQEEALWQGKERYDRLLQGETAGPDYVPAREELATLYRHLRTHGGCADGCDLLWSRLDGKLDYCKMMVALDALAELGLVELCGFGSERQVAMLPVNGKVDLAGSQVLRQYVKEVEAV